MDSEMGYVTRLERIEDDQGRMVMRATVDFYDGNRPAIALKTVWGQYPVKIVRSADDE